MRHFLRAAVITATAIIVTATPVVAEAQKDEIETVLRDYLATRPDLLEQLIREAIAKNPQIVRGAFADALKSRIGQNPAPAAARPAAAPQPPPDRTEAIKTNAEALFRSTHQTTLGNASGPVTVVEFFDYNCGFCRRAAEDKFALMADDPEIRVVLKELPILGPQSLEAAQVAVAVRMQDSANGRIYRAFNKAMFGGGQANRAAAMEAARNAGADMTRLARDVASDEIKATLDESMRLARALGITGTPSYVIGERVIPGAVGLPALREQVQLAKALVSK
ncbi:DsbA family protein [Tardiphaga sp.]|jgi:protein-disulfide isomerase|uniref:DsbA family protein n=1 Tax=Tardiphaga sp. TaxID=1926292 RepID=UPI0037DA1833